MSSSDFVFTTAGPVAPESAAVKAAVTTNWQAAFDNQLADDDRTPQGQLIVSETAIIQDKNAQLLYLIQQFDPAKAEGRYQDALAALYFTERHPERASIAWCLCTGRAGTPIPGIDSSADPALATDENGVEFICQTSGEIGADGTVILPFAARDAGPLVIAAHSITKIALAISGWDTIDNPSPGITGQSVEKRRAFEERRRASVARNSRSMLASIYAEVGQIDAVIDLLARQNRTNAPKTEGGVTMAPHSVYVAVLGGADAAIAEGIYNSVSGGCDYNGNVAVPYVDPMTGAIETILFQRPDPLNFSVTVTIRMTDLTPTDIESRVKANILADFYGEPYPFDSDGAENHETGRAKIGQEIYASRFYCPARAAGAANLLTIKIAADGAQGDSVTARFDQYPSLSISDIKVEVSP